MIRLDTLKHLWFVWGMYWVLYLLQPVHSLYKNIELAWLLQLLFLFTLSIAYALGACIYPLTSSASHRGDNRLDQVGVERIIRAGIWTSFIGLFFLGLDKIIIQGIDYSQGLATAREQWRIIGEERDGQISSLYSALGYFLGGAFFISLALTLSRIVQLSDSKRFQYMFLCFTILMMNSVLTGGRSSILLAIGFISFGYYLYEKRTRATLWTSIIYKKLFIALPAIGAAYTLFIFNSRALTSGMSVTDYSLDFLDYLGLGPSPWFSEFSGSSIFGKILALLNLAVSYLTHSLVTTAAIIGNADNSGNAVLIHLMSLGAKLGLTNPPTEWFLAGRFPSLPGALYMQLGLPGLLAISAILGIISGYVRTWFACRSNSIMLFFACSCIETVLLLSPFLFAGDLLFFPFMLVGGVIAIAMGKIHRKKRVGV